MSKTLVTGGAGFIGSHIVDRLIADGHDVVVLDNLSTGKKENLNKSAKFLECDIQDYKKIAPHFKGVEAVFHCAALARLMPSVKDPITTHEVNATGTLNVLWACHNAGVKKVIYSATSSIYGDQDPDKYPLKENTEPKIKSPYGVSKYVGEQYCQLFSRLYKLPTVILRYFNVYGPRQITEGDYATVIGIFLRQRQENKPMTIVGDGETLRDYTHVNDIVEGNILAWQKDVGGGEAFNLGIGKNYSVNEVAALIGGPTVNIPPRPWDSKMTLADNSKAKKLLGWEPKITFEEGIRELKKLHKLM